MGGFIISMVALVVSYFLEIAITLLNLPGLTYLPYIKVSLLVLCLGFITVKRSEDNLKRYTMTGLVLVVALYFSRQMTELNILNELFDTSNLWGGLGNNVLPKLIASIFVLLYLSFAFKSPFETFLKWGNPNSMAGKIKWLGIKEDEINWGKLSIISGVLIGVGTFGLTLITIIRSPVGLNVPFAIRSMPLILVLALMNSFSEGLFFRSSILASLQGIASKEKAIWVSAVVFGSFHFHGAPGGIIGVAMSTLLGWFLAKSVYETKGMLCGWFVHFCQDVVIFTTLALLGV